MEEKSEIDCDYALELEIKSVASAGTPSAEYIHDHKLIAKVPVVLVEPTLQIDVDATITLPEPAIEIKRVKKNLKLTQCMLLQNTNKLFVKGFVRKNIEFATANLAVAPTQVSGTINYTLVDIPFATTVPIKFDLAPIAPLDFNTAENFEFLKTQPLPVTFPAKDMLESGDLTEFNQINNEFFNELPFCELVSSRIVEYDEYLNRAPLAGGPFEEITFTQIEEKMVIFITLKIIQRQYVVLSSAKKASNENPSEDPCLDDQHQGDEEQGEQQDAESGVTQTKLPVIIIDK